jgi:hypothetical protein
MSDRAHLTPQQQADRFQRRQAARDELQLEVNRLREQLAKAKARCKCGAFVVPDKPPKIP